jgi:hypothetical protein
MAAAEQNNAKRTNIVSKSMIVRTSTTRNSSGNNGNVAARSTMRGSATLPLRRTSNGNGPPQSPPSHEDDNEDVSTLYNILETAMMNLPTTSQADGTAAEGGNGDDKGDGGGNSNNNNSANKTRNDIVTQCWMDVRSWLDSSSSSNNKTTHYRTKSVQYTGQYKTTPLHLACKLSNPPSDIIQNLIHCSSTTNNNNNNVASWVDAQGWLPLHHACANGACRSVLDILCTAYPQGKVCQDKRYRTPLHFVFFRKNNNNINSNHNNNNENTSRGVDGVVDDDDDDNDDVLGNTLPEIVRLLSNTGAAELPDEGGMIPLHYAAAYGTTRQVLEVLLEVYPASLTKTENKGRNPLHLAMVNAHRQLSLSVINI